MRAEHTLPTCMLCMYDIKREQIHQRAQFHSNIKVSFIACNKCFTKLKSIYIVYTICNIENVCIYTTSYIHIMYIGVYLLHTHIYVWIKHKILKANQYFKVAVCQSIYTHKTHTYNHPIYNTQKSIYTQR